MLFELRATFLHVKSMGASQLDCCKLVLGWFQFGDSNPSRDELNRFLVVAYGFFCSCCRPLEQNLGHSSVTVAMAPSGHISLLLVILGLGGKTNIVSN